MSFNTKLLNGSYGLSDGVVSPSPIPTFKIDSAITGRKALLSYSLYKNYLNGLAPGQEDLNYVTTILGTGFNGGITAMMVDLNGKIMIATNATTYNGKPIQFLARLNSDLTIDSTWNTGNVGFSAGFGSSNTLDVQSDGKILFGNTFVTYNGVATKGLVRFNTNGSLDTAFNNNLGTGGNFSTIQVLSNGQIILWGNSLTAWNGNTRFGVVKLNADGTEDTTFATNIGSGIAVGATNAPIALETSTGLILLGGRFSTFNGINRGSLIALNNDGTPNTTFNTNFGVGVTTSSTLLVTNLVNQGNQIIVGGTFTTYNGNTRNGIFRLNSDGTEDTAFYTNISPGFLTSGTSASSGFTKPRNISIMPDGRILAAGRFDRGLRIVNSDGSAYSTPFNTNFNPGFSPLGSSDKTYAAQTPNGIFFYNDTFTTVNGVVRTGNVTKILTSSTPYIASSVVNYNVRYNPISGTWALGGSITGDSMGIILTIDSTGQFFYTSNTPIGTKVENIIKWFLTPL